MNKRMRDKVNVEEQTGQKKRKETVKIFISPQQGAISHAFIRPTLHPSTPVSNNLPFSLREPLLCCEVVAWWLHLY